MVYNCRLFQVGKSAPAARLSLQTNYWGASVNDGHLYLQDVEQFPSMSPSTESWMVSIESDVLKDLELELRSKDTPVEVGWNSAGDLMVDGIPYKVTDLHEHLLDHHGVLELMELSNLGRGRPFAAMADRFRKFSLIKTPGEYPMDFKLVWHAGLQREMMLFAAGPTVRGALAVLDRKFLEEEVDSKKYLW